MSIKKIIKTNIIITISFILILIIGYGLITINTYSEDSFDFIYSLKKETINDDMGEAYILNNGKEFITHIWNTKGEEFDLDEAEYVSENIIEFKAYEGKLNIPTPERTTEIQNSFFSYYKISPDYKGYGSVSFKDPIKITINEYFPENIVKETTKLQRKIRNYDSDWNKRDKCSMTLYNPIIIPEEYNGYLVYIPEYICISNVNKDRIYGCYPIKNKGYIMEICVEDKN
ncbi:hypothetical protein [Anaerovorax odorimutans]|uniref:hypothetical protein n=1 Tax=Anaerovorax odorimutans TaxID=109327 RepID=UPI00042838DC|nr:hypothetical protein [Anaerovorax odorimutans]